MPQTNLLNLNTVQNEATRVILRTTKDTLTETMRLMLDLPSIQIGLDRKQNCNGQTILQCRRKSHPPTHNPALHEAVKDTERCRLGRG